MRGVQVAILSLWAHLALGAHTVFAPHGCFGDRGMISEDPANPASSVRRGGGGAHTLSGGGHQGLAWAPQSPVLRKWSSEGHLTCPQVRRGRGGYHGRGLRMEWQVPSGLPGARIGSAQYNLLEDTLSSQIKQVRLAVLRHHPKQVVTAIETLPPAMLIWSMHWALFPQHPRPLAM